MEVSLVTFASYYYEAPTIYLQRHGENRVALNREPPGLHRAYVHYTTTGPVFCQNCFILLTYLL